MVYVFIVDMDYPVMRCFLKRWIFLLNKNCCCFGKGFGPPVWRWVKNFFDFFEKVLDFCDFGVILSNVFHGGICFLRCA